MTVIVVRRDDNFSQMLRDADIQVVNIELVGTEVLENLSEFENLISRLNEYDGLFFTSPIAAQVFVDRVKPPVTSKIYALGRRSRAVLTDARFEVKEISGANTAEEMLAAIGDDEFAGKKLLFVSGQ